jgi:hypothetical protein
MTQLDEVVVVERYIDASPATVFTYFTSTDRWLQWQGVEATLEPWPGGVFRMNVSGDGFASGRFLAVQRHIACGVGDVWPSLLGDRLESVPQASGMVLQPAVPTVSLRRWVRLRVATETWGYSSSRDWRATETIIRTEEVVIDAGEVLPPTGKVFLGVDRIHRTFRDAHATIDALIWINEVHVRSSGRMDAVDRTHIGA